MIELLSWIPETDRASGEEVGPRSPQDRSAQQDPNQPQNQSGAPAPSIETAKRCKERRRRLDMVLRALI